MGLAGLLGLATVASAHCGGVVAEQRTFCAKACSVDADCCGEGSVDCPGPYPKNFACDGGLCRAPRCETDADCGTFVQKPLCRVSSGLTRCFAGCDTDADCEGTGGGLGSFGTCSGTLDDGTKICALVGPLCTADSDCLDPHGAHCVDGRCGCVSDADCAGSGRSRCADRQCTCASDAECFSGSGVCTADEAFSYPPSAAPGPPP